MVTDLKNNVELHAHELILIGNSRLSITWLKITVKISMLMHVRKALKDLKAPISDIRFCKKLRLSFISW